jgi:hypothetical protein
VTDEQPVQALSVGSVVGGSTPLNRPWRDAIRKLAQRVIEARADVESPLNVNVVFDVPGNVVTPDYTGARTGRFSKADALLMVQVALPAEAPEDPWAYLVDEMRNALDEAESWAARRGIAANLEELKAVVDRI